MGAPYSVLRRESVKAGSLGTRDAWVVESSQNGATMTFWLSEEAPFVIRLEMSYPNGTKARYEMI